MKNYYRIMLGQGSVFAQEAYENGFLGVYYEIDHDLTDHLPDNWQEFNRAYIPKFLERRPDKSKVAAGLACGVLYTIAKRLQVGDVVLSPDGQGSYFVGEITSNYRYQPGHAIPHQRDVRWYPQRISREELSESLKRSTGSIGTVSSVTRHAEEIERLLQGVAPPSLVATDEAVEDASVFALEQHLEDFLIENWASTELGKQYDVFQEDGEIVGRQYETDTGRIDILAISKDKNELTVVELKKGRAGDVVIGQVQRYMGYVKEELAEENQTVKGIIIAFEDDLKIRRALAVAPNIEFYTYKVSFSLQKK